MMKKILLTVMTLVVCVSLHGQQVRFGVKGGLQMSSLGDYDYPLGEWEDAELENKLGLYAGIFSHIYLTKNLGLETGLFYAQLGGREKENDFDERYEIKANPSYLQVPLSVFYQFNLPKQIRVYPSLGVYGGYGLAGKMKAEGNVYAVDITSSEDYFDVFANRFDFGGTAGIQIGTKRFLIGASYDYGLVKVNKEETPYRDNAFNRNVRFSIGYFFN